MKSSFIVFALVGLWLVSANAQSTSNKSKKPQSTTRSKLENDLMSCLDNLPNHGVNYFKSEKPGTHIVFITTTNGMTIETKAPHGFFAITPSGVRFCELNIPKASNIEFEYDGEMVRRHNGPGNAIQRLSNPTRCVDGTEDYAHRVSNYLYGRIEEEARASNLKRDELLGKFKGCVALPRTRELINRGISLRKSTGSGRDASSNNAEDN